MTLFFQSSLISTLFELLRSQASSSILLLRAVIGPMLVSLCPMNHSKIQQRVSASTSPIQPQKNTCCEDHRQNRTTKFRTLPILLQDPDSTPTQYTSPTTLRTKISPTKVKATLISARLGNRDAQLSLGDVYRGGSGVLQDYRAAMAWYLRAVD